MALAKTFLKASLLAGVTLGTLAIVNKMTEAMAGELDTVLSGEERQYPWKYGNVFYQVQGAEKSKPLVLLHSLSPGASSYEWRKNIDALAEPFRVYALDLLGFGLSDHPALDYDGTLYADMIGDFLQEVVGQPAILVGHGLSCAYAVAVAYRYPTLCERLILVAPPPTIL
jgi:pimeloyl-ACP methyl ester carboxylesterase